MTLSVNASLYQGEHKVLRDTIYVDSSKAEIQQLVNANAVCRIGRKTSDRLMLQVPAHPTTTAAGSTVQVVDPLNGIVNVTLVAGDTQVFPAGRYTYQVILTDSSGKTNVVTDGYLHVRETLPGA